MRFDADDHGNTQASATHIIPGSNTSGELTSGDTDYFEVAVNRPGTLLVYTSGSTDTLGQLEDPGGRRLAFDNDGGQGSNFRIERYVSAGTYYVRVTRSSGSGGGYTLHARFDADDHGNTRETATRTVAGSSHSGELTPDDTDYFEVTVDRPGILLVYTSGATDTAGRLETSGALLASDDNGGDGSNFRIERGVSAGTFYVRVTGAGGVQTGRYTLHLRLEADSDGDARRSATLITPGTGRTGRPG